MKICPSATVKIRDNHFCMEMPTSYLAYAYADAMAMLIAVHMRNNDEQQTVDVCRIMEHS